MPNCFALDSLVRRAQKGDKAAYAELVRAYLRPSYVIALAKVVRIEDAEVISHETLYGALREIETCGRARYFSAWLFQRVRNRAQNFLRQRRDRASLRDMTGAGQERPSPKPTREQDVLLSALLLLDPTAREIVLLHDLAGWSHDPIARALKIHQEESRRRLVDARRLLHDRLGHPPMTGSPRT